MIVVGTPAECEVVRRLVDSTVHRLGADAPDELQHVQFAVAAFFGHKSPTAAGDLAHLDDLVHDAPMSYSEAATAAGVSKRTIARRVADGTLTLAGRRIAAPSLRAWLTGSAADLFGRRD